MSGLHIPVNWKKGNYFLKTENRKRMLWTFRFSSWGIVLTSYTDAGRTECPCSLNSRGKALSGGLGSSAFHPRLRSLSASLSSLIKWGWWSNNRYAESSSSKSFKIYSNLFFKEVSKKYSFANYVSWKVMCRKRDPVFESSRLESQIEKQDFTPAISRVSSLCIK